MASQAITRVWPKYLVSKWGDPVFAIALGFFAYHLYENDMQERALSPDGQLARERKRAEGRQTKTADSTATSTVTTNASNKIINSSTPFPSWLQRSTQDFTPLSELVQRRWNRDRFGLKPKQES